MAIRDILKISRKTFVNPRAWLDYDSLKAQNLTIYDILRTILTPDQPERQETFTEAKARLELNDEDLKITLHNYQFYTLLFLICGVLCILYTVYLIARSFTFTGLLLGIAASALFFSQAFKFDFWALQLKKRKLGLTFDDWKAVRLGSNSKGKNHD
jgi:intracellular multiplication protein IcmV